MGRPAATGGNGQGNLDQVKANSLSYSHIDAGHLRTA